MRIHSVITIANPLQTMVSAESRELLLAAAQPSIAVSLVNTGLTDPSGSSAPGASSDLTHTHQQSTAADEWLVTHGLGKFPSVTVVDSAGDQVEGDVAYIDSNSLRISFSAAFAGRAYLN